MAVKASGAITLTRVDDGSDATLVSATAPADTTKMWLDISVTPNILKHYDGNGWVVTNDQSGEIQDAIDEASKTIITEYSSSLKQLKDELTLSVTELEKIINTNSENISSVQTSLEMTAQLAQFTKTTLEQVQSVLDGKIDENKIIEWARFDGAKLELGTSDSVFKAILTNTELGFYEGNTKVAWVSNNEFHCLTIRAEKEISVNELSLQYVSGIGYVLK